MRIVPMIVIIGTVMALLGSMAGVLTYLWGSERKKRVFFSTWLLLLLLISSTIFYQFQAGSWYFENPALFGLGRMGGTVSYGALVGLMGILVLLVILAIVKYFVMKNTSSVDEEIGASRRQLFKTTAVGLTAVSMTGGAALAVVKSHDLSINRFSLSFKMIPPELKGYKIAQLSDVHIGPYYTLDDFKADLSTIAKEGVDRLVITGDLVDEMKFVAGACELLSAYNEKFPDGIDYILGNHEYFRDLSYVWSSLEKTPLRLYRNTAKPLEVKGRTLSKPAYIVGVDYPMKQNKVQSEEYFTKAMGEVPADAFVILLAHHPMFIEHAFANGVPLTLTGHTHGGQVNILGIPMLPMPKPYWRGMYEEKSRSGENLYGYVSTGTGHWFPVRYNCPREITIFTL